MPSRPVPTGHDAHSDVTGPEATRRAPSSPAAVVVALGVAVLSGSMVAVQSRLNGALAETVGSSVAAAVSFGSGLALLSLLLGAPTFRAHLRRVLDALRDRRLLWWQVLGGVGGGMLVSTQTYAVPLIGVAAFLIAVIGGQTTSALLVDRWGLGPAAPIAVSRGRVVAAALSITGVALAASAGFGQSGTSIGWLGAGAMVVSFGVGLAGSIQYALNGRVTQVSSDPVATAWINFSVGLTTVLVIATVPLIVGKLTLPQRWDAPWWAWCGGVCGIVFIAGAAWAVQHTGVLVFGLVAVTTQTSVGIALDLANPAASERIGPVLLLGTAMTVLGAVVGGIGAHRSRHRATGSARA
ncbi:MAG: DMT family transporter [Ornithinimicrobium sp.]